MHSRSTLAASSRIALALMFLPAASSVQSLADDWFADPIPSAASTTLQFPMAADLNGDGIDDLVAQMNPGAGEKWYKVYLADASGHMSLADSLPEEMMDPRTFTIIDENGDGLLDIITTNWDVTVWLNDGTGHFSLGSSHVGSGRSFAVGDLDNDQFTDLAGNNQFYFRVYYGGPGGIDWANPQDIDFSVNYDLPTIEKFRLVDLNEDSLTDCVGVGFLEYEGAIIRWRLGQGNRQFGEVRSFTAAGLDYEAVWFDTADLDGDGDQDVVCSIAGPGFPSALFLYDKDDDTFVDAGNPFGLIWSRQLELEQLDPDDLWDAIAMNAYDGRSESKTVVFSGLGGGDFALAQELPGATHVAPGNVTGDQHLDLISVAKYADDWPPIGVWTNVTSGASSVPDVPRLHDAALRLWPSIASRSLNVTWSGVVGEGRYVEILDVSGRIVQRLALAGSPVTSWNLRNLRGERVPSGVYWLRVQGSSEPAPALRAVVLR